ncbi:hypothetical protein BDV98DRAFT_573906 [Pterulicium gracile]|uniref:Uncharacterized protein n=1 Tax=Pterulicium gracile TaxID=1884261 RepID=A0A5C3Q9K1_9AGAR|nr:hypothetical protein BDV98DRAFT_573906 [Pterula gracilis]
MSSSATSDPDSAPQLALPLPTSSTSSESTGDAATARFDQLGPLVVNSDGTLSRISNWQNMSKAEQDRTFRVLAKRNQLRLENESRKLDVGGT